MRVGEGTADSQAPDGLSIEEMRFDGTGTSPTKVCTVTEITPVDAAMSPEVVATLPAHLGLDSHSEGLVGHEVFESTANPGKVLLMADWKDSETARAWKPVSLAKVAGLRHRHVRVIRVYGMRERDEAPQYYPSMQ